jgi:hypothetical protein
VIGHIGMDFCGPVLWRVFSKGHLFSVRRDVGGKGPQGRNERPQGQWSEQLEPKTFAELN